MKFDQRRVFDKRSMCFDFFLFLCKIRRLSANASNSEPPTSLRSEFLGLLDDPLHYPPRLRLLRLVKVRGGGLAILTRLGPALGCNPRMFVKWLRYMVDL